MTDLAIKLIKAVAYLLSGIETALTDRTQPHFLEAGRVCENMGFDVERHVWTYAFLAAHLQMVDLAAKLITPGKQPADASSQTVALAPARTGEAEEPELWV
jgi:hypothetical protein